MSRRANNGSQRLFKNRSILAATRRQPKAALGALSASAAAEGRDDDEAMVFAELFVTMAMNPPSGKKRTRDEAMELLARYFVGQNLV
jgi:hypothetical protein